MTPMGDSKNLMSEINVTPFVDVMLVLLIIFMVTAPMMIQGVDVALPEVTSEPLQTETEHLIITIDGEYRVFINDYQVAVDNLSEKLSKILEGRMDRTVYLKADKQIPYGMVVGVMSAVKSAGIEKLGMVTIPVVEKNDKSTGRQ